MILPRVPAAEPAAAAEEWVNQGQVSSEGKHASCRIPNRWKDKQLRAREFLEYSFSRLTPQILGATSLAVMFLILNKRAEFLPFSGFGTKLFQNGKMLAA
jgi:hypothetical protein